MSVYNRHNGPQPTATIGWNTLLTSASEAGFRQAGEGVETRECEGESMPQNIYDDPEFFTGYSQLRRSREDLVGAPEWLVLRSMLPPLESVRVLDLGCGFGAFA